MELMPGYKQTEIGAIPEEWGFGELADLNPFVTSGSRGWAEYYSDRGSAFVRITNMSRDSIYIDLSDLKLVELPPEYSEGTRTHLQNGDLLVSITADIGIIGFIDDFVPKPAYINQHIALVRFDSTKADSKFLSYFLAGEKPQKLFLASADQGAKAGMSLAGIRKIKTAFPPLPEQRAIAAVLSDVDVLISGLDQLIAKKRDLKQAAMQQLLTGQTRLPGFREEWEMKRLEDVADVDPENLGSNISPDYSFNYISLENVDLGMLRGFSEEIFSTAPSRARRKLQKEDILISTVRPNLKSHLLFNIDAPHWICSTGFSVVRCKEGIMHPGFVFFHLFGHAISRQIETLLTGSNYPAINSGDVRELQIYSPGYDEQSAIATVLSDMAAEITTLETRRDKTRALKQGMMQELLTGKTRLV